MRRLPPDRHVECLAEDWVDLVPQRELHHLHPYDDATPAPSGRRFTNVVASPPALPSPPASSPDAWLALAEESMRPRARGRARETRAPRRAARARVRDRARASRRRAGSEDDDGGERRNPRGRERTRSARARVGATAGLRDAFLLVRGFRERVSRTETSRQRVPWHSSARALRRPRRRRRSFCFSCHDPNTSCHVFRRTLRDAYQTAKRIQNTAGFLLFPPATPRARPTPRSRPCAWRWRGRARTKRALRRNATAADARRPRVAPRERGVVRRLHEGGRDQRRVE